ncbi:uncharacterized protein LOC109416155 isoform X2 [Aedes albopictus]|uniref:Secreted protein n=1 Tax=Aedes albopictus TaxID=7160 RepID=A0ABM1Y0C2_AEDAL|nr:uncharacterized protein LOC109407400 isoform X2 [Aedes albopictus]XP_019545681.1 uncharacterized protein LOC109416155 isoform X2 [Aedes albopictus]XP_029708417.1 uncharacterized protein LOC115254869 isoform X2 [Aedes albopictus]
MMKVVAVLVVLCGISAGYSVPMRNAFMYYQQPMGYMGQRQAMYGLHYQNQQLRNQRRSAGVSAFAAGNNLAAGSYLKDVESAETPVQDAPVADAYPAEQYPVEDVPQQDVPAVNEFEAEEPIADEPVAAPAVPAVIPEKKKKKVTVQLDSAEEEEQDAQVARRGGSRPAAPNAYFPINFGSTNGGAIAIANSYSTGKGGSATSTATAYGSPATAELRRAAPAQLRKKPAKLRARY